MLREKRKDGLYYLGKVTVDGEQLSFIWNSTKHKVPFIKTHDLILRAKAADLITAHVNTLSNVN